MRAGAFAFTCLRLEPEHRVHPQPVPRELNRERWVDELGPAVWVHREVARLFGADVEGGVTPVRLRAGNYASLHRP